MRGTIVRRVGPVAVSVGLALSIAGAAQAHFGNPASITVTLDHVYPGDTFPVIAADFPAGQTVKFELARDSRTDQLGTAVAGADGHFTATFSVPADFPAGWADLYAVSQDGTQSAINVLVGPRTASTPPPPNRPGPLQDPAVLLLMGALAVGVVVMGFSLIRSARGSPARGRRLSVAKVPDRRARPRR